MCVKVNGGIHITYLPFVALTSLKNGSFSFFYILNVGNDRIIFSFTNQLDLRVFVCTRIIVSEEISSFKSLDIYIFIEREGERALATWRPLRGSSSLRDCVCVCGITVIS